MMSRMEMNDQVGSASDSSSGSDSGSTCEEERLRELFISCDADGDGFIDSNDLLLMCERLNMRDAVNDLHQQLGMEQLGRISFQQFLVCRRQLMGEIEAVRQADVDYVPRNAAWRISGTGSESTNPDHIYETIPETIEIPTMSLLLEKFHTDVYHQIKKDKKMTRFMEVIDQIHTKCLSSMKTDYMELTNRHHQLRTERELLEKQLNKSQSDHVTEQTVHQQRLDQMSCRYEERITELHSVIAELQKKFERSHQFNIIREEEECGEEDMSNKSEFSNTDNLAHSLSLDDEPVLAGINRVVSELECSETESDLQKTPVSPQSRGRVDSPTGNHGHVMESPMGNHGHVMGSPGHVMEIPMESHGHVMDSPKSPRVERVLGQQTLSPIDSPTPGERPPIRDSRRQSMDARQPSADSGRLIESPSTPPPIPPPRNMTLKSLTPNNEQRVKDMNRENEHLKAYVRDLERRLAVDELIQPQTTQEQHNMKLNEQEQTGRSEADLHSQFTVAKVAGLKKLITNSPKKTVREVHSMNLELVAPGLPSSKLAEHLSASVQDCSNLQEMIHGLESGDEVEEKMRGFQVEMERLTSQIDHLKSQNDVLNVTLDESKSYSDRLTVLFSKYESNLIALQLTNDYADNILEWYEVLCGLYETQIQLQQTDNNLDEEELYAESKDLINARRSYETRARALLSGLDGCVTSHDNMTSSLPRDHEKMSVAYSLSTSTSSSVTSMETELSHHDQQRLKDHIQKLKTSRCGIISSCQDLESVNLEPPLLPAAEAQRLDLENTVIMQEMMALKEEKSELKSQNYLLVREKKSLELRLNNKDLQEQSYQVQICHLKCEIKELSKTMKEIRYKYRNTDKEGEMTGASNSLYHRSDVINQPPSQLVSDLIETQRREEKLRRRVYDLVTALEKLSRDSELRNNQSADFVNDLKKANSSLISSFERAKKKYQSKVKKLEQQLTQQKEYYESKLQERLLKSQSSTSSEDPTSATQRRLNETSL